MLFPIVFSLIMTVHNSMSDLGLVRNLTATKLGLVYSDECS